MKTEICIPIIAVSVDEAILQIKESERKSSLIELRIDFICDINKDKLKLLVENVSKKVIVTCRTKKDNGNFNGTEKEKLELLQEAIKLKSNYVDVEHDFEFFHEISKNREDTKIIASYHNFKETPNLGELEKIYEEINNLNQDLVKIVTLANSINDNFEIFRLLKEKENLISFCMGLKGQVSRILAGKYGSAITFASLDNKTESAPGQLTIKEMKEYNFENISQNTNVLGVIGAYAENSKSKYMHNANFKKFNLDYVYIPFKVETTELGVFMRNFREFEFAGSAVTIPHKEEMIKHIDEVDETTKEIGAVNTLVNKDNKITGYNTDYYGAVEALKEKTSLDGKKVLVIGAGGAARAIIYGLKKEKSIVTIINRTKEKAEKLAKEFEAHIEEMENIKKLIEENDIIINTTSIGMKPNIDESVVDEKDFSEGKAVMDIVYNPRITKFIKNAEKYNCNAVTGEKMLIYQAIGQFKLWTAQDPDFKLMESELNQAEGD